MHDQSIELRGRHQLTTEPAIELAFIHNRIQHTVLYSVHGGQAVQMRRLDKHVARSAHRGTAAFADYPPKPTRYRCLHQCRTIIDIQNVLASIKLLINNSSHSKYSMGS